MRLIPAVTVALASALSSHVATAQASEHVAILRAAIEFVRADMPSGTLLLDPHALRMDSTVAVLLARDLGAELGPLSDVLRCSPGRQLPRSCTLERVQAVVGFRGPLVHERSARATIQWYFQGTTSRVALEWRQLRLAQDANGQWRVTDVLEVGKS
jgi:hypothetical protein